MRIHRRRRSGPPPKPEIVTYRYNEQIGVPEVRVVDEEGKPLGVMPTTNALQVARERGYDLVEVSPKAVPPVCRFLDYGAFKYQKEKELKTQKAHAKKVDIKGVRLSVKMGENDFNVRRDQALGFLEDGHKLRIEIRLRGREKAHGDLGKERIQTLINKLSERYQLYVEQPIANAGGNVSAIVGRKT